MPRVKGCALGVGQILLSLILSSTLPVICRGYNQPLVQASIDRSRTPGSTTNPSQEPLELPKGPMTRALASRFQKAVSYLIIQVWEENQLDDNGVARTSYLKNPCTLVQAELSSSLALQAPFNSNQLT
ncbi:hypothetical protein PVK06_017323 [Gossypium arboreum]|uniref:Uncharacterized protein n=1 Tax=Gossypium arboreum TaxID=29729 RepID=A0ABR0Q3J1_GOSAR|nr:hypothetical protein PVK06_017323 [Gossypium arboreum]